MKDNALFQVIASHHTFPMKESRSMFKSGDLVVLKQGYPRVLEIATCCVDDGCDLWNEDDYLLRIAVEDIRWATYKELEVGHRVEKAMCAFA